MKLSFYALQQNNKRGQSAVSLVSQTNARDICNHHSVSEFIPITTTGPPNRPVGLLFCWLASVVVFCLSLSSVVVCNAAGGGGRPPGAWAIGCRRAGRVCGRAADTAGRASTVTSCLSQHWLLEGNLFYCSV